MNKRIKQKSKIKILAGAFGLALLAGGYSYVHDLIYYEQGIAPPVEEVDVLFDTYTLNVKDTFEIYTPTGTSIIVEPYSFADINSKLVDGEVTLKVREFHDALSIMTSGIPMSVNEDRSEFLQSAGMIEIRAQQKGKELGLVNGKTIKVKLANFKEPDNYSLYNLNDESSWDNKGDFGIDTNWSKQKELADLPAPPKKPKNPLPDSTAFTFYLGSSFYDAPYLKPFEDVEWELIGTIISEELEEVKRVHWDSLNIKCVNKIKRDFKLTFYKEYYYPKNDGSWERDVRKRKIKVKARPVLNGADKDIALAEFNSKLKEFKEVKQRIKAEEKRLAREADLRSTFEIYVLGIWNIDKVMDRKQFASYEINFDFEKDLHPFVNNVSAFVLMKSENSVVAYKYLDWDDVWLNPNSEYEIYCMLPNSQIAYVSPKQIESKINRERSNLQFQTEQISIEEFRARVNKIDDVNNRQSLALN